MLCLLKESFVQNEVVKAIGADEFIRHVAKERVKLKLLPLGAFMLASVSSLSMAQQATPEPAKSLPTVDVKADADKPDGVRATTTRVGKTLQDPHDIPQAITTVTGALMEQQHVGSLKEALRNVSGLSFNAAEGGRSGDNMNLRGFYTFGDLYLDDIRDTAQYNRETFNLEQIDVLRGAGAMLFGRGQAGGVINQVSKTPLRMEQYKFTGSKGSQGFQEATADINKPINDTTALRVNVMQRDEGSWRSNPVTGTQPEIHRKGSAVSLGLNLRTDNQFWINYQRSTTNDNPDYGVSFDGATRAPGTILPSTYFWNNKNNFDRSKTSMTTLINEYRFSPDTQLRTQIRNAEYGRSYWAVTPNLTTPPNALGGVGGNQTRTSNYKTLTVQSDLNTKFQTFGMKHEVLLGFEYLKEDSYRAALQNFGTVAAPVYYPDRAVTTGVSNRFTSKSHAFYAQDTVEFIPKWKVMAGVRRDLMDAKYNITTSPQLKFAENSFRTALSHHPDASTHYYVAKSSSFSPTADLYQWTTTPQPAERSNVVELGAKWLVAEGDLALRAALYRATKDWERNGDLDSTAAILTRKRRTSGLELEAAGRINDKWEVFSGLSFMNAKILEVATNISAAGVATTGNAGYIGQQARNTPKYTFNVWSTYQLDPKLQIGGGVELKGERQGFNPSGAGAVPTLNGAYQPNTAPSYARWDAMVKYDYQQWIFRLNVKNIFDKVYYDAIYDNGPFTVPGSRRSAVVTAEYKF